MKSHHFNIWVLWCLSLLFIMACNNSETDRYTPEYGDTPIVKAEVYLFGIHPLHNPQRLHEIFGPIADLLTREIKDSKFKVEASRNYSAFDEKLYSGKFAFALPNPYQTIISLKHGYRVFGKMGDDKNFRGILLVRKDSGIHRISDLKGKTVCFPAPTALAATMMPQSYLQKNGIDVNKDIKIRYVGSQESSIMNVFLKNVHAGATWPPPWRALSKERPELLEALDVKWETEPLPNNGLVVKHTVPQRIVKQVAAILFDMQNTETGRAILSAMELSRFEPASDETYKPVTFFLEHFNKNIRKIDY